MNDMPFRSQRLNELWESPEVMFKRIQECLTDIWESSPDDPWPNPLSVDHIVTGDAIDQDNRECRFTVVRVTGITGGRGNQPDLPSVSYRTYMSYPGSTDDISIPELVSGNDHFTYLLESEGI